MPAATQHHLPTFYLPWRFHGCARVIFDVHMLDLASLSHSLLSLMTSLRALASSSRPPLVKISNLFRATSSSQQKPPSSCLWQFPSSCLFGNPKKSTKAALYSPRASERESESQTIVLAETPSQSPEIQRLSYPQFCGDPPLSLTNQTQA